MLSRFSPSTSGTDREKGWALAVPGLPSSTLGAKSGRQLPAPLQRSAPLQALLSPHGVSSGNGIVSNPSSGSQRSTVHGLPSSSKGGTPSSQLPDAEQSSAPLQ